MIQSSTAPPSFLLERLISGPRPLDTGNLASNGINDWELQIRAGSVVSRSAIGSSMFIESYANPIIHRRMLRDRVRCEAYARAIREAMRPGCVVADVGSGTGIMAILAAQLGASKVFAVEPTRTIELARSLVRRSGLEDRVLFFEQEMETVVLSEQVDVIISEWIGSYGVEENLLAGVLIARDRWLKPGGRLLPERVSAHVGLVQDRVLAEDLRFWRSRPYGYDLGLIADRMADELLFVDHDITAEDLLAPSQPMWTHDAYDTSVEEARKPFIANVRFVCHRGGLVSGMAAWFHAEVARGVPLTNAPSAPKTHWRLAVMPLARPREVFAGMAIEAQVRCSPAGPGLCHTAWTIGSEGETWEHHDTAKLGTLDASAVPQFFYPNG